jgi:hypothetical protein
MKFKLVEKIVPYRGNNDRANHIADELYYGDVKELKRMRDKLRKDAGLLGGSAFGIYVVENDDNTYDIYDDLEFIEGGFENWEDVVNYCKFMARESIRFDAPSRSDKRFIPRDEAIVYNNDKFMKALKQLIIDKVNIRSYDFENHLLAIWKDGMKSSEIIKKYHLDEKVPEKPVDYNPSASIPQIHSDRWTNSRYQGRVSYNDWSGDSPFDEYGEVYEDLDMKDLDDEI